VDIYGTHFVALTTAVARSKGPVLELGSGDHSTPLLHYLCKSMGRLLVTADTEKDWLERYRAYESKEHEIHLVTDWEKWVVPESEFWGVIFVDQKPGESRAPMIRRIKGRSQFVVVHDTETDYGTGADYKYEPEFALYKHRVDFRRFRPYTTVVSNFEAFEVEECDKNWTPPK
jgi:hypothetical protein